MDVPFESFVKLVYHLGNPPRSASAGITQTKTSSLSPSKIFQSWLNHLPKPLPQESGKHVFRLLFPHEGSRRRYGLKESKLALELESLLGLRGLSKWDRVYWDNGESGTGCLGKEIELLVRDRSMTERKSTVSIREIDILLDELASSSTFSRLSQDRDQTPTKSFKCRRSPQEILTVLYRESNLTPFALSVLTQIILRDLRPLLNPLPKLSVRNPTTMLRMKSNTGPEQLSLKDALCIWDKRLWGFYNGGLGNLDRCSDKLDNLENEHDRIVMIGPVLGINVKIPKCRKGRSIPDALSEFTGTRYAPPVDEVWAETKYDGYRMQIHVDCSGDEPRIKVYSKSTRDSTDDRSNTHSIILASLDLPIPSHLPIHPSLLKRLSILSETGAQRGKGIASVILEAEVVPFNEASREGGRGPGIEEFWWLGNAGVTASAMPFVKTQYVRPFIPTIVNENRHLCLVFFDILYLDGQSLLHKRYEDRRALLETVIRPIQGFSQLAERTRIPLGVNRQSALQALEEAFQRSNERCEEGLVLKASNSTYANMKWQWVKLKKDYIPNLGDCIDLVLLGAGWDIDRARELRVDTSVFTTFYLGVLTNPTRITSHKELPHFEILFRVSYGPDRPQLEYYNECLRHGRWGSKPFDKDDPFKRRLIGLSWTYTLQKGMIPPSAMFEKPLCAEVMGAGFQKCPGSNYYELRWPRLQKIYEPSERQWIDALSAQDLIKSAHQALGYHNPSTNSPYSPPSAEDSIRALWRSHSTINLIDIPLLVSPKSPKSPKRVKSEPNLNFLLRDTNPSPTAKESGRKLMAVLSGQEDLLEKDEPLTPPYPHPQSVNVQSIAISPRNKMPVEISRPTTPPAKSSIILGPPLPLSTPRRLPQRKAIPPISPAKRLISSIDWSSIDMNHQSTPKKAKTSIFGKEQAIKKREKNIGVRPLSLRSRLKLAIRRVGVKS
ncbi:hypothetical protein V865_002326 [Kwoniella europaea PYCC6329]|uniref:ATP-dependent DNA ligase family profile domain-containing protein n=1 Tax=Kwoniella europaea PYCC6329 TaxID=1423913 RepID=A0AAX4KE20_9TREE